MGAHNVSSRKERNLSTLLLAVTFEPEEVGRRLKKGREAKRWTQLQAALEANVSPSTIQRWESGKLPPIRELERYAELLGLAISSLVEPPDEDRPAPGVEEQLATLEGLVREVLAEVRVPRRFRKQASQSG